MPANESYYDRSSMDSEYMEEMSESSIGGMLKKRVMKVGDDMEMKELKDKAEKMGEGDFVPVSDDYGNELCVYVDDFPELAKLPRGTEVMFMVRCGMNRVNEGPVIVCKESRNKVSLYIWDAKLCGVDKE